MVTKIKTISNNSIISSDVRVTSNSTGIHFVSASNTNQVTTITPGTTTFDGSNITLTNLSDVAAATPTDGHVLKYSSANTTYYFAAESGGGGGGTSDADYGLITSSATSTADYGAIT